MTTGVLAAYAALVATIVSSFISQIVKPLLESAPAFAPSAPNQRAHDALLRLANVALNLAGVGILAAAGGYLTLANWQTLALQIVFQVAWSHGVYQTIKPDGAPTSVPLTPAALAPVAAPTPAQIAAAGMIAAPPSAAATS